MAFAPSPRSSEALGDRDRTGGRERAIVEAGAGDDVADRARVRRREADRGETVVDRRQVVERDMRQDQVLLVRHPDLVVGIVLGEVGDGVELVGAGVAGRRADRFQRHGDDRVALRLMGHDVGVAEALEARVLALAPLDALAEGLLRIELGRGEEGRDPRDLGRGQVEQGFVARLELGLDLGFQRLEGLLVHQDLDARLVLVVAPALEIVDAQDRLDVAEQIALRQEVAHLAADERRAPEAAADIDGKAQRARGVADDLQADVVRLDHRAVVRRAVDRDLELARQEAELRMQRRPLPQISA